MNRPVNKPVFDSSAVIALLRGEPGADLVLPLVGIAVLGAVNASEVQSKLVHLGVEASAAWSGILQCVSEVIPFDGNAAGMTILPFSLTLT